MAREAGAHDNGQEVRFVEPKYLEAFAALVREDERDKWMERTTILIRGEREACAKVCEETDDGTPYNLVAECAKAIRARGQA
jgi:hypothetical protein